MVKMLRISQERKDRYKEILQYLCSGEDHFTSTEDAEKKIAEKFPDA